jgi:hypothetical protein
MNSTTENRLENPDTPHIFLDIDGVLATTHQYRTNRKKWHPTYDCYRFDEKCVEVFNTIIEKVNPVIILSSDWKDHYTIAQMNEIFAWNGVNGIISDVTPSSWGVMFTSLQQLEECRSYEINVYANRNHLTNWVAVDDLNLKLWIPERFVHTPRANEGIKQSGIKDKILNIINK